MAAGDSAEALARTRLYTVRHSDTLVTIADRFGVSLSELRRWNGIPTGIRVESGRRLRVAEPAPVRTSSTHRRRTTAASHSSKSDSGKGAGAAHGAASAQSKPGSTAHKPALPQGAKPAAHPGDSAAHKSAGASKTSRQ